MASETDEARIERLVPSRGFFRLGGDHRLRECSTEGCFQHVSYRFEGGGIGSDYCEPCARAIDKHMQESYVIRPADPVARP